MTMKEQHSLAISMGTIAMVCLVISGGCSDEQRKSIATSVQTTTQNIATQAQDYASSAQKKVEEQLPASGSAELILDPPIEISSASVEVIKLGGDRKNVVQISTYDIAAGPSKFPCMLVHGATTVESAEKLSMQTIPCDLYVQNSYSEPVKMTPPGESVQATFGTVNPKTKMVKVSIGSTRLIASDNKTDMLNGGNVVAKVTGG